MGKKISANKTFLDSIKDMVGVSKTATPRSRRKKSLRAKKTQTYHDPLASFLAPMRDMDSMLHPPKGRSPRPCPTKINRGVVLSSRRHKIKCILLESLENVDREVLKNICAHRLKSDGAIYLPVGTSVLNEEVLHQGRSFSVKLAKGTLFLSPGGHPNGFLLDSLQVPLKKEPGSNPQYLAITEQMGKRYLQNLVDIPLSFTLIKEDIFFDPQIKPRKIDKGSLIISRSGVLTGLLLADLQLPIQGKLSDVSSLFQLRSAYQRFPLETLIQRLENEPSGEIPIARGTFIFSPRGKVYFVWRENVTADEQKLVNWSIESHINEPGILEVSLQKRNHIGGPGEVITQEELNYLRDVFRQAGTTNIYHDTLLLDRNVFFKFIIDMPYAQSGKFRSYLKTGGVVQLNTFRKGNFSVEMGGKGCEITDLDLPQVRKHLQSEGLILIKIGSLLRIRDEREGDWVYSVTTNLFYPYSTFTRPYIEEFIPEHIRFDHRDKKISTLIGPQEHPKEHDIGASGEPLPDLLVLINNELKKDPPRIVFVLDGTLFIWNSRLYRVNEEMAFRPRDWPERVADEDLLAREAQWQIHPVVEDAPADEDESPPAFDEDEDLDDLPFDTPVRR